MARFYMYREKENSNEDDEYIGMINATSCKLENGDCRVLIGTETLAYIKNVDRVEAQ